MDAEEIWSYFKLGLRERISSPLLLTFSISWVVANYRLLLIIFGNASIDVKLTLLDQRLYPDSTTAILRFAVDPAIATVLLIFVYPFPARWVYTYLAHRNQELIRKRQEIEGQTPITKEEQDALNARMRQVDDQRRAIDRENAVLRSEINDLQMKLLQKMATTPRSDIPTEKSTSEAPPISKEQVFMLNFLGNSRIPTILDAQLIAQTRAKFQKLEEVRAEYFIDELLRKKFIDTTYPAGGGRYLKISSTGRAYLVEKKLVRKPA